MSIRHNILKAIATEGATMNDLCDRLGVDRKKMHDNVKSCVTDGLAIRGRDDITGLPFYTITAAGRARLAEGPVVGGRKPSMTTQPEEVKITGSAASVASSEAPLRLSTEGCAVIEPPKPVSVPVAACSDEIRQDNDFLRDRLKAKDEELFKQSQLVINLRRENQALTAAVAVAKRRQTSGVGDKYMLLYPDDKLFDTPEQAAASATQSLSESEIEDAQIIAVNPIGRIEVRTVFVPHADDYKEAA